MSSQIKFLILIRNVTHILSINAITFFINNESKNIIVIDSFLRYIANKKRLKY